MEAVIVTEQKLKKFKQCIKANKKKAGPLMPTLHDAQNIFGCIPIEVQKIISKELNESVATINGVVTFYSQFSTVPKGEHIVAVCLGTACYVRGSQSIINKLSADLGIEVGQTTDDGKYTLEATRCIGACGLAPVMSIGHDISGNLTVAQAETLMRKHREKGVCKNGKN